MATQQTRPLEWLRCLGRDGWDSPLEIPEEMAVEALNWRFTGALGKRREGGGAVTLTGDPVNGQFAMAQFIPGQDPTQSELFIVDTQHNFFGVPAVTGTQANLFALDDPPDSTGTGYLDTMVQHNGKLFVAYNSGANLLHVYDPVIGYRLRRVGIPAPGAPTVSNVGAGTYPATIRYYRTLLKYDDGISVRISNLSPATAFTPSGTGTAARVTFVNPAFFGDYTAWQVHGSADNLAYYQLSGDLAISGGAFYDDSTLPSQYPLRPLSPLIGANTPWPSVKFLGSDGLHLFGFGVYETAGVSNPLVPKPGRVYFSPALGSSDTGDDERISDTLTQRGWIDCNPQGGGVDRGISGPLNNRMYVFQSKGIYMLVPTGDPIAPFARVVMTTSYGSVSHWSQVIGEDQDGQPCLYFLDPADGPRRISVGRTIEWLGKDVNDFWKQVNLNALIPAFGVYDSARKLVLWWISIGADVKPTQLIVFDVTRSRAEAVSILRYGWSRWTGTMSRAYCAVMFSRVLTTTRSQDLVPYVGSAVKNDASLVLLRNDGTLNTDAGDPYQSEITSAPYTGGTLRRKKRIMEAFLLAKAGSATVTQTLIKNFGESTEVTAKSLAPVGTEARVRKFYDETDAADLLSLQVKLGDGTPLDQAFEIDQWIGADELEKGAR